MLLARGLLMQVQPINRHFVWQQQSALCTIPFVVTIGILHPDVARTPRHARPIQEISACKTSEQHICLDSKQLQNCLGLRVSNVMAALIAESAVSHGNNAHESNKCA